MKSRTIVLTKDVFNTLIADLLNMEDAQKTFFAEFFPYPSKERNEIIKLADSYLLHLEKSLKEVTITDSAGNDFPYVIISCRVTLQQVDDFSIVDYRVISPLHHDVGAQDISFLSPMGKALLLKKTNDLITVAAPGGSFSYRILAIKLLAA